MTTAMSETQPKFSVYLCGAHCTGKTTLQKNLQSHPEFAKFHFKDQDEVARKWIEQNGIAPEKLENPEFLFNFEKNIVRMQHLAEEREIQENCGTYTRFIWDRGIVDPIAYVKAFVGDDEMAELLDLPYVKVMLQRLKIGEDCLIFVLKPEKMIVQSDGVRMEPEFEGMMKLHESMIALLKTLDILHVEITCLDLQDRTKTVLDAVKSKWQLDTKDYTGK